jgi:hypothetical protein
MITFIGPVIPVTSVLACIPPRCSRDQVVKRILVFGLYWNGASGRFLRTNILDDIRLGNREADRRIG